MEATKVITGGLGETGVPKLANLGIPVYDIQETRERVAQGLSKWPNLKVLRDKYVLVRRLTDPTILFPKTQKFLSFDSDVFINGRVRLPESDYGICYMVDDVSGYSGPWTLPLRHPMVLGLNGGFIAYDKELIDFDFLEYVAKRFMFGVSWSTHWWIEQSIWSLLAARTEKRYVFDGRQCCIINGKQRRSEEDIAKSRSRWITRARKLEVATFRRLVSDALVIHFAGGGRGYLRYLSPTESADSVVLDMKAAETAKMSEAVLLSIRMGVRQIYKDLRGVLRSRSARSQRDR